MLDEAVRQKKGLEPSSELTVPTAVRPHGQQIKSFVVFSCDFLLNAPRPRGFLLIYNQK